MPPVKLFDSTFLSSLTHEFRKSMRNLLDELCDELEKHYPDPAAALRLPVAYFRLVGQSLRQEDYSGWKGVGWIEELNDLVYFIDLREQLRREKRPRQFAKGLLAECEEQFYENSYLDELFPRGEPESAWLARRLSRLCVRLAQQVIQESLFLVPGLPCDWLEQTGRQHWSVRCDLSQNFERVELAGCVSLGVAGAYLEPPAPVRREFAKRDFKATLLIRERDIRLRVGRLTTTLLNAGNQLRWGWRHIWPVFLKAPNPVWPAGLTLSPTLVYSRKDRAPIRVACTSAELAERIRKALAVIEDAWPDGARNLALLSQRIVPLKAHGVVSFSYRHRPGLSFINTFEREGFDLIDDLVHENSHHHLNLLLRKYVMQRHDRNQEIFYSPWRRSLRPLRGILHATFTFTMGALLFERLSSWDVVAGTGLTRRQVGGKRMAGLRKQDVLWARFRCLEEVASVQYSIQDLSHADRLGWMSPSGRSLVRALARQVARVWQCIAPFRSAVMRSRHGSALRAHIRDLKSARTTYGLLHTTHPKS